MKKFFSFFAALLFAGSMMAEEATMTAGTNGSACTVNGVAGIKCGTSSKAGDMTITVGAGATKLSFYAAAWKGVSGLSLNLAADGVTISPASVSLTADDGISNNTPFTLAGLPENFKFEVDLSDVSAETVISVTSSAAKRFVVWGASYETGEVPPTPADTYTVAGNDAAIFGTSWDVTNTANDMVKAAGIYKWEKAELNLTAGTIIAFKVAKNHSWDVAYPAQNDTVTIAEEGEYTLTITFDPSTEAVAAEAVKKVPLADPTNCAEAAAAALSVSANNELYNNGAVYTIEGYVTSIAYAWGSGSMSFWMADAADGGNVLEAYKCAIADEADAVRVGDKVQVTGSLTKYNTTPEFAQGCTVTIIERAEVVDPVNLGEKTIAEFLELANTKDTCILTGVIADVVNAQYGNFYLVEGTDSLYVYGLKDAAGAYCFEAESLAEGDTLKVLAIYSTYNNKPQAKNAIFVDVKKAAVAPSDTIALDFNTENTTYAFVDNQYFMEYGSTDIYLSDIPVNASTYQFEGDGNYLVLDFYPENPNNVTGVYQALDETLDLEYTYMLTINGTDTAVVEFADGAIQVEIGEVNKELGMAQLALAGQLISTEGDIYAITALVIAYYDFLPEEGVEDVVIDPKAIKRIVNGQVVIEKAGKSYNMNGAVIR